MKRIFLLSLLFCLFLANSVASDTIRVACIGNSITQGSGIKNPRVDGYPAVLQRLLGDKYKVYNMGLGGRTLLNKGDRPYMKEQRYKDALALNPDIVVIKLGTNDTKTKNWVHSDEFMADMDTLITSFERLPSSPKIYLCIPVPVVETKWTINDSTMVNGVIPKIKAMAEKKQLPLIDLRTPLLDFPQYFPDKIHPNESGAIIIAREVYKALTGREETTEEEDCGCPKAEVVEEAQ